MLRLINVCKSYKFGKNKMDVLNNINLDFKKRELVFILGSSGSGKSTLLNIIGGLVDVTSGCVMLDDKDITKFDNRMLCNYRNNMVGFIFQDYHLVEYMNVMDNIKLGQTIKSDSSKMEDILRKLGIYSKRKSLVNKLSGGEKQRVAIARSIINDPDIILADEPTGALDSSNSIKIMNILKDISKDKLVIVVSHDEGLANKYADRIIRINDGKVDYYPQIDNDRFREISKKKISYVSILKLAIKNLCLKKGRTLMTSIAISIGFICMIMVLCLSKSFNEDIDNLEREIVSNFPVSVYNGEFDNVDNIVEDNNDSKIEDKIRRRNRNEYIHENKIDNNYINYVRNIDSVSYIGYYYDISMPVISDRYKIIDNSYMKIIPSNSYIDINYDILYGRNVDSVNEILLKVDSNNRVDSLILDAFLIDDWVSYEDIVGRKIKILSNDEYYIRNGDYFYIEKEMEKMYKNSIFELEIVGIIREKNIVDDMSMIYYSNSVIDYLIDKNSKSEIVLEQIDRDDNVLGIDMDRYDMLSYLGYESIPSGLDIYVDSIESKDNLIRMLDEYNDNNGKKLYYVDMMNDAIEILENIINVITIVLVIFSMIGIIVSCMMIFILTNNRVMERVREIGILRGLGARNKDITRLFNIENMIISVISCFIGIGGVYLIKGPVNNVMGVLLDDSGMFKIYGEILIGCCLFNMFMVVISGLIPSRMASKKKIIDCIYGRI